MLKELGNGATAPRTMDLLARELGMDPAELRRKNYIPTESFPNHTIASGLYKNDGPSLARWIKNARHMKPGSIMNTIGRGEDDPILKTTVTAGLDDRQIADVVAYLMALK